MINKSIKYSPKLKALGFLGKSSFFFLFLFFHSETQEAFIVLFLTPPSPPPPPPLPRQICISKGKRISPQTPEKSKLLMIEMEMSQVWVAAAKSIPVYPVHM